jgi:aspartate/methionine/tyrosine aminotransferase
MGAQQQLRLADRLSNLGTETAFAVSKAAAEWATAGNEVFPFHLGDIDLATPRNIVDAMQDAIDFGYTGYCAGAGIEPLRAALAHDIGSARGLHLESNNIAVQPGGKPVITKFIQTLMNSGDGVLYPTPGYPIYESQVEYFGGTPLPYGYSMTPTGFEIDLARSKNRHQRLGYLSTTISRIRSVAKAAEKRWNGLPKLQLSTTCGCYRTRPISK